MEAESKSGNITATVFAEAQDAIFQLMATDSFLRFRTSDMFSNPQIRKSATIKNSVPSELDLVI